MTRRRLIGGERCAAARLSSSEELSTQLADALDKTTKCAEDAGKRGEAEEDLVVAAPAARR